MRKATEDKPFSITFDDSSKDMILDVLGIENIDGILYFKDSNNAVKDPYGEIINYDEFGGVVGNKNYLKKDIVSMVHYLMDGILGDKK